MRILNALANGLRRTLESPLFILGLYFVSLAAALPLAIVMRGILKDSIGASLVDEKLTAGFDLDWYGEFSETAGKGLASTFGPSLTGILPQWSNLERLLDGELLRVQGPILLAAVGFLLAWAFLAGGILDRYSQPSGLTAPERFFSRCGEFFFRFVRLQALSIFLYWLLFRWLGSPLHRWITDKNRDVTEEFTMAVYVFLAYAMVAFVLIVFGMAFDYAKIAIVIEHRRSSVLSVVRGLGFSLKYFPWTFGLYFSLLLVGGLLFFIYSALAPGPGQTGWGGIVFAFLVSQVYLLTRLVLKLWFWAGQATLFVSITEPNRY